MKYPKRQQYRSRRLVVFVVSVLPLLADDAAIVAVVQQQLQQQQQHDVENDNHNDHDEDTTSVLSRPDTTTTLPQHTRNDRQLLEQQQECHRGTQTQEEETWYTRTFSRHMQSTNQKWVVEAEPYHDVRHPIMQYCNGSSSNSGIIIPFDPLDTTTGSTYSNNIGGSSSITNHDATRASSSMSSSSKSNDVNRNSNRNEDYTRGSNTTKNTTATTNTTTTTTATTARDISSKTTTMTKRNVEVDYASKSAGAVILDSSRNFQGTSNLLQQDRDRYAIVPCDEEIKYVVIGLSEDILVKQFVIANYERYSSHMKEIKLFSSVSTHAIRHTTDHWIHLGNFIANVTQHGSAGSGSSSSSSSSSASSGSSNSGDVQQRIFDLLEPTWARYLKIEFVSHYGDEYYCTVSQISVHGSTVLQGFHEQWNEEQQQQQQNVVVVVPNDTDDDDDTDTQQQYNNNDIMDTTPTTIVRKHLVVDNEEIESTPLDNVDMNGTSKNSLNDNNNVIHTTTEKSYTTTGSSPSGHRYNFSRLTGCRNSMSFEANLIHFSNSHHHNTNISDNDDFYDHDGQSSSLSILSQRHRSSSLNKVCTTTSHTIPRKQSIRHVHVRHPPNHETSTTTNTVLSITAKSSTIQSNRRLSKLSSGLERVADFLRNALGALNDLTEPRTPKDEKYETDALSKNSERLSNVASGSIDDSHTTAGVAATDTVKHDADNNRRDTIVESNGLMIANLLQRLPNAKCLESLNFVDYKANIKAASTKTRSGSGGSSGMNNGSSSSGNAAVNMEPIFKKLTDEIKSLQSSVAIHDQFAIESVSCYQRVIFDLLLEMESDRRSYDRRLTKLEDEIHFTTFAVALRRLIMQMLTSILHYCTNSIRLHLLVDQSLYGDGMEGATLFGLVLLLLSTTFWLWYVITVVRRRNRHLVKSMATNNHKEINIGENSGTIIFQYKNHIEHDDDDDDDSSADIQPVSPNEQHQQPIATDQENNITSK